jgi:hypothetical protein
MSRKPLRATPVSILPSPFQPLSNIYNEFNELQLEKRGALTTCMEDMWSNGICFVPRTQ